MGPNAVTAGAPGRIWDCGVAGHRHLAKAEAVRCLEGHEHAAAGDPPATARKSLAEIGRLARIIIDLDWLHDRIAIEAVTEPDDPSLATRLQGIIAELCDFLRSRVAEESAELVNDSDGSAEADLAAMAVADNLRKARQPDFAPVPSGRPKLAGATVPPLDP